MRRTKNWTTIGVTFEKPPLCKGGRSLPPRGRWHGDSRDGGSLYEKEEDGNSAPAQKQKSLSCVKGGGPPNGGGGIVKVCTDLMWRRL